VASAARSRVAASLIGVWDPTLGEPVRTTILVPDAVEFLTFSPDGKVLMTQGTGPRVQLWDAESGQEVGSVECWYTAGRSAAFSPDGRLLATLHPTFPRAVRLWDVASGQEVRRFDVAAKAPRNVCFSADGKTLALTDAPHSTTYLVETATGKERGRVSNPKAHPEAVRFTANGRALAWSDREFVGLTGAATGKELRRFPEGQREVADVAVTEDGTLLASLGQIGTVTVWAVAGLEKELRPPGRARGAEDLDGLWKDLGSDDAARAYQAVWALAASPGQAVALVRDRVAAAGPLPQPDADRFARLLAELDADAFERRTKATEELAKMGSAAEGLVRAELKKGPASVEVRARLERILETVAKTAITGEVLRPLRAVEVLEQVGTAEARQVLAALAEGAAEARLTREAKAAEARLVKRPGR
jgi:hypothetical protein